MMCNVKVMNKNSSEFKNENALFSSFKWVTCWVTYIIHLQRSMNIFSEVHDTMIWYWKGWIETNSYERYIFQIVASSGREIMRSILLDA